MTQNKLVNAGLWKTWILLCVAETARMGISPISTSKLHVILYLANTLADFYGVTQVRGRILKRGDIPFFPDVQPEIDRLAFSGVLSIKKVEFGPKGYLAAHYGLGDKGKDIYQALISNSIEAELTAKLFRELVTGYSYKSADTDYEKLKIGPIDANYGNEEISYGQIVDFAEWSRSNSNMDAARYMIKKLSSLHPSIERDGVHLYCHYLDVAMEPA